MSDANEEFSESKPPAEVEAEATVTAGDDSMFLTGWNNLPESERQAYLNGYGDYLSNRRYNPPAGHEKAYEEGWKVRRQEDFEEQLRAMSGLR